MERRRTPGQEATRSAGQVGNEMNALVPDAFLAKKTALKKKFNVRVLE
jgi:hypothetical protein